MKFENINVKNLARFVALRKDREEVEVEGLGDAVPIPRTKTTFNSFLNPRGKSRTARGDNQFRDVKKKPDEKQVKNLLGIAVGIAVEECIMKHYYTIGGKVNRQRKGGSIGSSLTGETARAYMLTWDRCFLQKLEELNITVDLYRRYIDDICMVLNTINVGWKFDAKNNKMIFVEPAEGEEQEDDEVQTFKILQMIANSICPEVQMTIDVPGNYSNRKLPVLDLNLWMSRDSNGIQKLCHTFYKKNVSSKFTIMKRSAMSMAIKRTTHFQEAIRRLKNCDKSQNWLQRACHLSEWGNMLRISGYDELYRYNILIGAITRYEEIVKMEIDGSIENLYRNRSQVIRDTIKKGGKSAASTWFMRGNVSCTLNTAPTPNSVLSDKLQVSLKSVVTSDGTKTKVIETGGVPVFLGLRKADPFRKEECMFGDPKCIVEGRTSCGTMSATYQLVCSCGEEVPVSDTDNPDTSLNGIQPPALLQPPAAIRARMVAGRRVGGGPRALRGGRGAQAGRKERKISNERKNYIGITGRSLHMRQTENLDAVKRGDLSYALARHMAEDHRGEDQPRP
jgi:hypothetical protein